MFLFPGLESPLPLTPEGHRYIRYDMIKSGARPGHQSRRSRDINVRGITIAGARRKGILADTTSK